MFVQHLLVDGGANIFHSQDKIIFRDHPPTKSFGKNKMHKNDIRGLGKLDKMSLEIEFYSGI